MFESYAIETMSHEVQSTVASALANMRVQVADGYICNGCRQSRNNKKKKRKKEKETSNKRGKGLQKDCATGCLIWLDQKKENITQIGMYKKAFVRFVWQAQDLFAIDNRFDFFFQLYVLIILKNFAYIIMIYYYQRSVYFFLRKKVVEIAQKSIKINYNFFRQTFACFRHESIAERAENKTWRKMENGKFKIEKDKYWKLKSAKCYSKLNVNVNVRTRKE